MEIKVRHLKVDYHPISICAPAMRNIAGILKQKYNIVHFSFQRLFAGKKQAFLTTHPDFSDYFFKNKFHKKYLIDEISLYQDANILWDSDPVNDIHLAVRQHSGLAHGLVMIRKHSTYVDTFFFATTLENAKINNFYLNQMAALEDFTSFFKKEGDELIQCAENSLIVHPKDVWDQYFSRYVGGEPLHEVFAHEPTILTKRELELLTFVRQGLNTKAIARVLNISGRTVDKHFEHIFLKCRCKNKIELLALF